MNPASPPPPRPIESAATLWKALAARAGIERHLSHGRAGRDFDLPDAILEQICKRTGIAASGRGLEDVLRDEPGLSAELLLRCALTALRPFGAMMADILKTLAGAGARSNGHSLRVRFALSEGEDPLDQTLDEFREVIERISRALVLAEPLLPTVSMLDDIRNALESLGGDFGGWPDLLPSDGLAAPLPSSGVPDVDQALEDVRLAVNAVRHWLDSNGVGSGLRRYAFYEQLQSRCLAEPGNAALPELEELAKRCVDYIEAFPYAMAHDVAQKVARREIEPDATVQALAPALGRLPRAERWVQTATRELTDLLNLPIWKKRSELYSVWIGCRLLRTLDAKAEDLHLHTPDGVLSFAFGGAKLGTYTWAGRGFEAWAEMKTGLPHGTLFKKRTRAMQPDYRVVESGSLDPSGATRFVLECKHYLTPDTEEFVAAADDYARNCENATVLLVNHGRLDADKLTQALRSPVTDRVRFLGNVIPEKAGAGIQAMEAAVVGALFPSQKKTATTGGVIVRWSASTDVDLRLEYAAPDGAEDLIHFNAKGSLQTHPFACLQQDVRTGPGEEHIVVSRWLPGVYDVIVKDFDETEGLQPGSVTCYIAYEGIEIEVPFPAGSAAANRWHVASIDTQAGTVRVVDKAT